MEISRATQQLPNSINLISETILVLIFKYYTIINEFYFLYMLLTCYFCNLGNASSEVRKMEQRTADRYKGGNTTELIEQ